MAGSDDPADGRRTAGDPTPTGPAAVTGGGVRPGPGQARVAGVVTDLTVPEAALAPLPFPLELNVAERGTGQARIEPATVDNRPGAVLVWDSGTPLPIRGPGALALDGPARLTITGGALRVHLDGAARTFPPGTFSLGATVAVGRSGLAQPRDGVRFATEATTLQTSGDVFTVVDGPIHVEGPSTLTVRGRLSMERSDGDVVDIQGLDFSGGPFVADLTPVDGGWRIDALLQGAVVAVS